MDWIELITEEDVELLMEHVDGFHDWYVAGFSYDPLAQSEDDDLSLARFKVDADALTITFRWDAKTKRGTWPEVQVEFRCLHVFNFSNYNDPDPLWGCVIEKTIGGAAGFSPTTTATASARRSACIRSESSRTSSSPATR